MQNKLDKAGLGFKFNKKFLDNENAKDSSLNNADATKTAMNRFLCTFWLLNSDVYHTVTDNLVQNHITGIKITRRTLTGPMPWRLSWKRTMAAAEPHLWPRHTNQVGLAMAAQVAAAVDKVAEEDQNEARGAAVVDAQMGKTDAITVAAATILLVTAPMMPMSGEVL